MFSKLYNTLCFPSIFVPKKCLVSIVSYFRYASPNEKNWSQILNDMLDIQEQAFTCLDIETCFEICMIARLKSKSTTAIQNCINLMEVKKTGRPHLKVSYERAIDLILEASNDYFNNSKSLTDPDMHLAKYNYCILI